MCIICVKPVGAALPDLETFKVCHDGNPHGAGYMLAGHDNGVCIRKGFFDPVALHTDIMDNINDIGLDEKDLSIVVHWRHATHGSHSAGNCHPFPLSDQVSDLKNTDMDWNGIAMAHNGVFRIDVPRDERDLSDTQQAILEYFHLAESMEQIRDITEAQLDPLLQSGRLVFLDDQGNLEMKGHWLEDSGLFWSNGGFRRWSGYDYPESLTRDEPGCANPFYEDEDDIAQEMYFESEGTCCLYCTSCNIERGDLERDENDSNSNMYVATVKCLDCGETWRDIYELSLVDVDIRKGK